MALSIITPHETWRFLDSSKIQAYMECPRMHFYKYILGWRSEHDDRNDLHFGKAIHAGMEVLMNVPLVNEATPFLAYQAFLETYREQFSAMTDEQFPKKNPARALRMYDLYCKTYGLVDGIWQTLYTEVAGTVPISLDDRRLTFRLDAIRRNTNTGKVWAFEHKTASQASRQWRDQWYMSMQVGIYTHVLNCLFKPDEVGGVVINGLIFNPKEINFDRVLVTRGLDMMETWLVNLEQWLVDIDKDYKAVVDCSPDDNAMTAFKQNTTNCTKFFGCPFIDFCQFWPNPIQKVSTVYQNIPPEGFKEEWWDPTKEETKAKYTWDIDVPLIQS